MPAKSSRGIALPSLEKRWSIGIYAGADPLTLAPPEGLANPVMAAHRVTDARARFVADPFMLRDGSTWYTSSTSRSTCPTRISSSGIPSTT